MSHQPNWQEYGNPMVTSGEKTAWDVHESIYGAYQEMPLAAPAATPSSTKFNPSPFIIKK